MFVLSLISIIPSPLTSLYLISPGEVSLAPKAACEGCESIAA